MFAPLAIAAIASLFVSETLAYSVCGASAYPYEGKQIAPIPIVQTSQGNTMT